MKVNPAGDCIWEIPPSEKAGMLVPARIYASETLLKQMDAGVFEQVTNVAWLPGDLPRKPGARPWTMVCG
jgi:tRNA-splicing ligase RtcB